MKKIMTFVAISAIALVAHANTLHGVGAVCQGDGTQGFQDGSSAAYRVACVDNRWVDVANLDNVSVTLDAVSRNAVDVPSHLILNHVGFVGIPTVTSMSSQLGYTASSSPSGVTTASLSTGLTLVATVTSLNAGHTAHVTLDIDVAKATGGWHDHVDVSVPVGVKTVVARDDTGVEYSVTVDKITPQKAAG